MRKAHSMNAGRMFHRIQRRGSHEFNSCAPCKTQEARFVSLCRIDILGTSYCAKVFLVELHETIEVVCPECHVLNSSAQGGGRIVTRHPSSLFVTSSRWIDLEPFGAAHC